MSQIPEFARQRMRQQAAGDHPDANLLSAFAEQALSGGERDRVLAHLAACHTCREVVALSAPEALPAPVLAPEMPVTWLGWSLRRWASVGAALVIVGSAVTSSYLLRSRMQAPAPAQTVTAMQPAKPEDTRVANEGFKSDAAGPQASTVATERAQRESAPAAKRPAATAQNQIRAHTTALAGNTAAAPALPKREEKSAAVLADVAPPVLLDKSAGMVAGAASARPAVTLAPPPPLTSRVDVSAAAETVEVSGGVAPKMKAQPEVDQFRRQAPAVGGPRQAQSVQQAATAQEVQTKDTGANAALARNSRGIAPGTTVLYKNALAAPVRWRAAADGSLERLTGSGWESVPVTAGVTFRAVSVVGFDVWAGGNAGALYHSSDGGQRWERVRPRAGDTVLSADITRIEFTDGRNGRITTGNGENWTTSDAGRTWTRQ